MGDKFESVVMYGSWLEVARSKLEEDDVCRLMVQLMEYGLTGKVPQNDNVIMATIFEMAKPNIDSNIRKKVSGKKGGRPRKEPKTIGLSNVNANGNANANGNVNANDNDATAAGTSVPDRVTEDAALGEEGVWMIGTKVVGNE